MPTSSSTSSPLIFLIANLVSQKTHIVLVIIVAYITSNVCYTRNNTDLPEYKAMAPALIELNDALSKIEEDSFHQSEQVNTSDSVLLEPGRTEVDCQSTYEHEDLRPSFPDVHWEPLTEVPYVDKGLQGDPQFRSLLAAASDVFDYNPKMGTEIHGVDLASLTNAQKDDLARLVATRGVVFFRNQARLDIDAHLELGRYFGELHKHATTSVPRRPGLDEVHVIYADGNSKDQRALFTPTFLWHSDVWVVANMNRKAANL